MHCISHVVHADSTSFSPHSGHCGFWCWPDQVRVNGFPSLARKLFSEAVYSATIVGRRREGLLMQLVPRSHNGRLTVRFIRHQEAQ